ncbi:MAG: GyrI-like domain-containing protein [Planctomycetota bacterium]
MRVLPGALLTLVLAACATAPGPLGAGEPRLVASPGVLAADAGVTLTTPPFEEVHTQWKERLPQGYVFLDHRGPRERFGDTMRALLTAAEAAGIAAQGAPFGLFWGEDAARACVPVNARPEPAGLSFDVLPRAMVAYAVVSGPYPDAPRALPGLRAEMQRRGWEQRGPVRELYLVNPADVADYGALAAEIQVPWAELP